MQCLHNLKVFFFLNCNELFFKTLGFFWEKLSMGLICKKMGIIGIFWGKNHQWDPILKKLGIIETFWSQKSLQKIGYNHFFIQIFASL